METSTPHANGVSNNQRGQYLEVPEPVHSVIEARLRRIIRHELGRCMEPVLEESQGCGEKGTVSPCELCLRERVSEPGLSARRNSDIMTVLDSKRSEPPDSNKVDRSSSDRKERRHSLQMSDMYTSTRSRVDKPRSRSFRFSKEEINAFLPRRSFFSCHDKALKEAGRDTEFPTKTSSRRQNKETLKDKQKESVTEEEKKLPVENSGGDSSLPTIVVSSSPPAEPEVKGQAGKLFISKAKLSRKRMEDDFQRNEYKAVTDYLKYVQEHPSEYIEHLKHLEEAEIELKPVERLIKTASIYQRGHHGKSRSSPVVRASHDLKLRYTDPGQWQQVIKEKTQVLHQVFSFSKKEPVLNKLGQDGDREGKQDPDEGRTELERTRLRAERWLKTVPMCQQLKARQMALEEVGEEDTESAQWWRALRSCHYIRNIRHGDTTHPAINREMNDDISR